MPEYRIAGKTSKKVNEIPEEVSSGIILFILFCHGNDDLDTAIDTQRGAVQTQIVIMSLAPCTAGVVFVINHSPLILFI